MVERGSHMVSPDMKKLGHRRCLLVVVNRATCFARASGSFAEKSAPLYSSASPIANTTPTPSFSRRHFHAPACYISIKQALTGDCGTPGQHTFRCKLAGKDEQRRPPQQHRPGDFRSFFFFLTSHLKSTGTSAPWHRFFFFLFSTQMAGLAPAIPS